MDHNKIIHEERALSGTEIESGTSGTDEPNINVNVGDSDDTTGVASSMALERSTSASSDDLLQETSGVRTKTAANQTPRAISRGLRTYTLEYTHKPIDTQLNQSVINSSDVVDVADSNTVDSGSTYMTSRSPRQRFSENSAQLREKCRDHNEIIKMFCRQHDQVCCSSCIALHHRYDIIIIEGDTSFTIELR